MSGINLCLRRMAEQSPKRQMQFLQVATGEIGAADLLTDDVVAGEHLASAKEGDPALGMTGAGDDRQAERFESDFRHIHKIDDDERYLDIIFPAK